MLLFKLASLEEDAIDRSMLLSIKDDVSELISAIHLVAQTALSEKWISTAAAVCPMFSMLLSVYQDAFANAHLYVCSLPQSWLMCLPSSVQTHFLTI
jgi:hypothetical protein